MRRRFTLTIVGVVAGALLIAGLGTLALLTVEARHAARDDVVDLADHIAIEYSEPASVGSPVPRLRALQDFLKRTQELTLVAVSSNGTTSTALPEHLQTSDLRPPALAEGETVTGFHGRTAFAAVPFVSGGTRLAAVVTQEAASVGDAGLFFLLASAVILLIAFEVAATLARRITAPVVSVQEAAGRIAYGDLTARVPASPGAPRELESLAASVNLMADNLERLRGQERQFLLSVSHDLRTPLTSIKGFAEALADGTTTDTPKAAGIIASEARRLERLVGDLLDLAKLDAHAFSLNPQPIDLPELINETARGFRPTAEGLGLSVVIHDPVMDPPPAPPVVVDSDRTAQVVANLVENACKYAATTIEVGTWFRPGEAVVTVDDDGPGISPANLPRVFDRLWTSSQPTGGFQPRAVGSGLGLAIVAELVSAMGGTIRAESPVPRRQPLGADGASRPGTRLVVTFRAGP